MLFTVDGWAHEIADTDLGHLFRQLRIQMCQRALERTEEKEGLYQWRYDVARGWRRHRDLRGHADRFLEVGGLHAGARIGVTVTAQTPKRSMAAMWAVQLSTLMASYRNSCPGARIVTVKDFSDG